MKVDPLVAAFAMAAAESFVSHDEGHSDAASVMERCRAMTKALSDVVMAARAVVSAGSDGGAYVPDLADALRAADSGRPVSKGN